MEYVAFRADDWDEIKRLIGAGNLASFVNPKAFAMTLDEPSAGDGRSRPVEIRQHTTETGTSYDVEHAGRTYRLRVYNNGRVHLWLNGAHYAVKSVGHETVKSFSTNVVLAPIEPPPSSEDPA